MASSMPEIGSKISLISKADIRYEGKLFTVDPSECTIALSHVRSFGTEDRQTQYPVPAQSQVYEYILFRGSDIKDITIVNTQQLPNDPAIVSGMAPNMSTPYPNHNYNPVMAPPVGAPQYNYSAPGVGRKPMSSELLNENVHIPQPIQVQVQPPVPKPKPILVKEPSTELLSGSRSSTPSQARKSPSIDQSVQVSPHKDSNVKKPIQPPVPRENRQNRNDRNYQELYQRRDYRNQRDGEYRGQRDGDFRGQRDGDYRGQRDNDYRGQRDNDFRGQRDGDFRGQRDGDFRGPREQRDNDYRGPRDQEHRVQDNRREPYAQQHQQLRGQGQGMGRGGRWVNRGGRGGGGGPEIRGNRGGRGGNFNRAPGSQQQNNANAAKKNTLKFDEEYDFDKANSEFEELKNKTAKLKISDAGEGEAEKPKVNGEERDDSGKPKVNGEEKKDDSGNETGLGEGEPEEDPDPDSVIYYDKAKSFFDNISCEAIERSKGRSQRTDWRTERKLNSETFGVASARRGGYRGRGGYYGGRGLYRGYRGYNMRGQGNRGGMRPAHIQQPQTVAAAAK